MVGRCLILTFNHQLDTNSSLLPSNTLVLSLSPPGQSFYLPSSSLSRSSTPSTGYTSDPESATRKANQINKKSDSNIPNEQGEVLPLPRRRHRSNLVDNASHSQARGVTKTAGWQDLFKYILLFFSTSIHCLNLVTDS